MEECLAEWSAPEVRDRAMQEIDAGSDGRVWGVFAVGEDAESAFEGVDPVHIEQGKTLATEDNFILQDGLLDEVLVCVSLMLASGQCVCPTLTEAEFPRPFVNGPVEKPPELLIERGDWNDHQVGGLACWIGFSAADE